VSFNDVRIGGSYQTAVKLVTTGTATYVVAIGDTTVIKTTGGAQAFTMPAAAANYGRQITFVNHGTGNITFSVAYRTANNTTTTTLAAATALTVVSDGTEWRRISS